MKLILLLQIAAVLHIGLACAGAAMPRTVNLGEHLKSLPPFIRNLFWVYYSFIGFLLIGFGVLTFVFAEPIATGEPVARGLCLLLLVFWLIRLVVAAFVFDVRPYLVSGLHRLGYHATNVVFVYLVVIYAIAAWKGFVS